MATFVVMNFPRKLEEKLQKRIENKSFRKLTEKKDFIDFSSNDYLGLSKSEEVFKKVHDFITENKIHSNGSTGSRLISGNHALHEKVEQFLSEYHKSESALIFNSGYDANLGLFSSVPQKGDVILYDELIHASIRDGITMSHAKAYKFKHNNTDDLQKLLERFQDTSDAVYIVTESIFSMDGDAPDLKEFCAISNKYKANLIVDEAHAVGVFGQGKAQEFSDQIFARVVTFGKALGCHGAAILGSLDLRAYLINFARSFIYTTALPPHSLATILISYQKMMDSDVENRLRENIHFFKKEIIRMGLHKRFIESDSAIHSFVVSGNEQVKKIAGELQKAKFDVKPILSPTVPKGEERIRFCLHSFNSFEEITGVLEVLRIFVEKPS